MPFVHITKVTQAGDAGGAGVSRFAWKTGTGVVGTPQDASNIAFALNNMYDALKGLCPSDIVHTFDTLVEVFDEVSGLVAQDISPSTNPQPVTGTGGASGYPAGVGARINWHTNQILGRRFMRGCTFYVPLVGIAYGAPGNILPADVSALLAAANAYLNGAAGSGVHPVIWHRPLKGQQTGGVAANITQAVVKGTPAVLHSRRV